MWLAVGILCLLLSDATHVAALITTGPTLHTAPPSLCEPLWVPACTGLGYSHTLLPNLAGHATQRAAAHAVASFSPLLRVGCAPQLRLLLCGFYAPLCSRDTGLAVPPCRPLCTFVQGRCAPVMAAFGYPWPDALSCDRLPLTNTPHTMCMEGPPPPPEPPTLPPAPLPCPVSRVVPHFTAEEREFASVWMALWAVVCAGLTLFALVSYALSRTRYGFLESSAFRYPERCCVHSVVCYCAVAGGFLLRLALGPAPPHSCIQGPSTACVLVFILLYYFTMAAAVWWTLLCGCWLADEWRGWRHVRLLTVAAYMHLSAWGLPAVLTIAVLVNRALSPDDLTGTCYPGHDSTVQLVQWVLLPHLLLLLVGTTLLLLTFACLWREHMTLKRVEELFINQRGLGDDWIIARGRSLDARSNRQKGTADTSVPRAVEQPLFPTSAASSGLSATRPAYRAARVGVIAMMYMLPSMCQVGALLYESGQRERWAESAARPSVSVFMFKIFASLAPGVALALFLANSRVMHSWRQLGQRLHALHSARCHCTAQRVYWAGASSGGHICCSDAVVASQNKYWAEDDSQDRHVCAPVASLGKHVTGSGNGAVVQYCAGMGTGNSGGINGPCQSSTGCDSQESSGGVFSRHWEQNDVQEVRNQSYNVDRECVVSHIKEGSQHNPMLHHHHHYNLPYNSLHPLPVHIININQCETHAGIDNSQHSHPVGVCINHRPPAVYQTRAGHGVTAPMYPSEMSEIQPLRGGCPPPGPARPKKYTKRAKKHGKVRGKRNDSGTQ